MTGRSTPRDVVVITREFIAPNKSCRVGLRHYGTGSTEDIHWMLSTARNKGGTSMIETTIRTERRFGTSPGSCPP